MAIKSFMRKTRQINTLMCNIIFKTIMPICGTRSFKRRLFYSEEIHGVCVTSVLRSTSMFVVRVVSALWFTLVSIQLRHV